ncbi:MAG: FAD-dependent oxidoreductase [Microbacteriaceae bacterium]|nr:FAD-dependent oxidoreductase [Microbacteriaceae bacterium]
MGSITIVGASLAGHASAKALRAQGFTGTITLIGGEAHQPYDRPPLSKGFLSGALAQADLALEADAEDLGINWLLGSAATHLDAVTHTVTLSGGHQVTSDAIVIATGSRARTLGSVPSGASAGASAGASDLAGLHTLRNLEDAIALRSELIPGARLVIVGSGFIGLEVASTAVELGVDALVLGSDRAPLARLFGERVAATVTRLHERHGVRLRNGVRVTAVLGPHRVTGVQLDSGEVVPADLVLLAIGSEPNVEWLADSGLAIAGGVVCDERGNTSAARIVAVGDCAAWFDPVRARAHRIEHWTDSRDRAAIAVTSLLEQPHPARPERPSYLWSDQCDARIQFAGRLLGDEEATVEVGDAVEVDEASEFGAAAEVAESAGTVRPIELLVVYRRAGECVAVLGINQPSLIAKWRKRLTLAATDFSPSPVRESSTLQGVLPT